MWVEDRKGIEAPCVPDLGVVSPKDNFAEAQQRTRMVLSPGIQQNELYVVHRNGRMYLRH